MENGELKVKASHILLKFEVMPSTREALSDEASYIAETAKESDLASIAKSENLELQSTNFFSKGGFIPGIGMERSLSRWAFSKKIGDVSDVVTTDRGYIVATIADIEKEHVKPLAEVKSQIELKLSADKKMEIAKAKCQNAYEKIQSGSALDQVAQEDSLQIQTVESVTKGEYVQGIGREPGFIGATFALRVGEISKPVRGTKGYYLIQVIDEKSFDEKEFEAKKKQIRGQLMAENQRRVYGKWYNNLKEKSKIKDFRDIYYY